MAISVSTQAVIRRRAGLDTRIGGGRPRVMRVFLDVNLSKQFGGLTLLCHKAKIYPETLPHGTLFCFINRARTYIKVLACNSSGFPVLACKKFPTPIADLRALAEIPRALALSGTFSLDGVEKALDTV